MHILIVPSYYPSPEQPITGIFFKEQAEMLRRAGHQVSVLALPRIDVTRAYLKRVGWRSARAVSREDDPDADTIPTYRMHWGWFPRVLPPIVVPLTEAAGMAAFDRYRAAHGMPDVLHAHNLFYGGVLAARLKRAHGIPVVLTEHSTSYMEGLIILPGQAAIIRRTLAQIDAPLAVSRALAMAIGRFAPDVAFETIGNVIDMDFFTPDPSARAEAPFLFSAIGRLHPQKRHNILLDAFSRACKGMDARLHIGGDGDLRAALEAQADALGIREQVSFLGWLSRDQVRAELRRSHVHIMSSWVESFGITLVEAMACGVPVIATDCGGTAESVTPDNGIMVPVDDADALAAAMRRMIADHGRYDSARIRETCVARFSAPAITARLNAIYASLR